MVQSALSGVAATLVALRARGDAAGGGGAAGRAVRAVMRRRAARLEERGAVRCGQRDEELVVVRADRAGTRGGHDDGHDGGYGRAARRRAA
ncbi:hypothetical protein BJF79_47780 [Actinomadura sp. CNU-125]|nr:hypothetical protein BJF79_47780 [Actinomadura sp. CNU-125]